VRFQHGARITVFGPSAGLAIRQGHYNEMLSHKKEYLLLYTSKSRWLLTYGRQSRAILKSAPKHVRFQHGARITVFGPSVILAIRQGHYNEMLWHIKDYLLLYTSKRRWLLT
jgi:hypothetical protein